MKILYCNYNNLASPYCIELKCINCCIGIKIDFETKVSIYFTAYNAKNNILSLKILFVSYNNLNCIKYKIKKQKKIRLSLKILFFGVIGCEID